MDNKLKNKIFEIKIRDKSASFFIQATENESENEILNTIAKKISNDKAIIILSGKNISDKKIVKLAQKVRYLCSEFDSTLLIHNRADIAFISEADGIYLDKEGITLKQAQTILGENTIIIEESDNIIKFSKPELK